jgi:PGF-pre-PGF domain-containing protein
LINNTVNATCAENWTCVNWTVCNISGTKTRTCIDTNHCGTNVTRPALTSTCTYSANCTENWTCATWSSCNASGIKKRTCTDTNSCGTNTTRPSLNSTCTYSANCTESWICSDWGACNASGTKTKTCADTNNCGTTVNKPALTSTCTYSVNEDTGASGTEGVGTNITQNVTAITPANPVVINISDSQIYLTKITLNVLESIQSASVTVTKVNVLSDANLAMGLPSGQFYQGFRVDTSGVTDSNIANVTIEFKVNKLWLAGKNGTAGGIGLYRKPDSSSQWNSLITTLTSQDSVYYYFTSVSPGFSTFAVFSKACEGIECETAAPSKLAVWLYIIIAVVGVGIIVTAYVLLRNLRKSQVKKEEPKKPEPKKL